MDSRDTAHKPRQKHKANVHKNLTTVAISHSIIHRPLNAPRDLASNDATERIMKWSISLTSGLIFMFSTLNKTAKV